ncbi:MAG: elongation factor P 5-aminopentanone reductase [Eubacteriales bacterium]|jgi:3-oxoacyl-[acyl-carrier protein] reductase
MKSRTVLITGASRGIGAATARAFSRDGYNVAINYFRSYDPAVKLKNDIEAGGGRAEIYQADVSDNDAVEDMVSAVQNDFGRIDVLVNNAGIAGQRLLTDITIEEWERMFAVNMTGVFLCSKHVAKQMISRKSGKIINISSIWGMTGSSCEVHYSASKAAVIGFTKALAKELGPSNIQVNCVAPGVIETEMNGSLTIEDIMALKDATPLERIGKPEEVAETILFLASEKADFITGQVLSPNGGIVI